MKEFYHSKKKKTRKWKRLKKKIERWRRKRNVIDLYRDQLLYCKEISAMKYYYQDYHLKKKKIRGWKRHKRNIERWRQNVIDLDNIDYFRERYIKYVKISKHPFNESVLTTPPNWYKRIWLSEMIEVYLRWYEKMAKESDDFYLKILFYEQNFMHTRIVASYKYKDTYLNEPIFPKNPVTKIFPLHKFESIKNKLALFDWEAHINVKIYSENEDFNVNIQAEVLTEAEVNEIRNKSYEIEKIKEQHGNFIDYKINIGDVWVGTLTNRKLPK
ncbi:hypothetical protein [Gottfriedia acidiceleris]|uniref:hypothetical protein n=1 Tax=Gottfriedia acidiceleris TaxID=371036 RepID=UPI003D1D7CDE